MLREPLTRLIGHEGFQSLLRRAVTLANADAPWLGKTSVDANGRLQRGKGPHDLEAIRSKAVNSEAAITVAAHFLGLLVTFIGERLTTRLVQQAWPEPPSTESDPESEDDR